MGFKDSDAAKLLAQCHRRCCICHRCCGVKIELDHIEPRAGGGSDEIENAIPVCFNCHAEIHLYNDKHPRGRKFKPDELRLHKEQWLRICAERPGELIDRSGPTDVGPLQALVDELQFNLLVSEVSSSGQIGCLFEVAQFERAIHEGYLAMLDHPVREPLMLCYKELMRANGLVRRMEASSFNALQAAFNEAQGAIIRCKPGIESAFGSLLQFLRRETDR